MMGVAERDLKEIEKDVKETEKEELEALDTLEKEASEFKKAIPALPS